ncbi:hypothetical protein FGO68_gene16494 [Halteria grandinella]|uniref:Uncharacterized protein n=1 Tax=Halteria grandinella TaxID=5974 RepID=A0A8J8NWE2_HALGN|nr:hypothetical protein FGO68_gene16494 [Halteria grandinella]
MQGLLQQQSLMANSRAIPLLSARAFDQANAGNLTRRLEATECVRISEIGMIHEKPLLSYRGSQTGRQNYPLDEPQIMQASFNKTLIKEKDDNSTKIIQTAEERIHQQVKTAIKPNRIRYYQRQLKETPLIVQKTEQQAAISDIIEQRTKSAEKL